MTSTLTLAPVAMPTDGTQAQWSRVAIVATTLLGDTKGEWFTHSFEEAASYAADLVHCVDTKVYLFNTQVSGERVALPFALIGKGVGWLDHPSCLVDAPHTECV